MRPTAAFLPDRRRQQRIAELLCRVVRRNKVGKHRNQDHDENIRQPDDRAFIAFEIVPELPQWRHGRRCGINIIFSNL